MRLSHLIKTIFVLYTLLQPTREEIKREYLKQKFLNFHYRTQTLEFNFKNNFDYNSKSPFITDLTEKIENWNKLYENLRTYEFEYLPNNYFKAQIEPFDVKIKIKLNF